MKTITNQDIIDKLRAAGHISRETRLDDHYWVDGDDSVRLDDGDTDEGAESDINLLYGDITEAMFKSKVGSNDTIIEFFFGKTAAPLYTVNRIYEIVKKDGEKIICRTEEEVDAIVAEINFKETVAKVYGKVGAIDSSKIAEIIRAYKEISGE